MTSIFKKILLVCGILIFSQNLVANEQTELRDHFLGQIDKIILLVEDKKLSTEVRNSKIVDVLTPTFDFELMAKLSLGKKWKKLQKIDQIKFVNLYVKRMEKSYSSKLDAYSDEKVEVKKIHQPKANRIALETDLVSKDENLEIIYKFYKPKKREVGKDTWLIYDVEIMGVSILKTDKAQFKEYLQTNTIDDLMEALIK